MVIFGRAVFAVNLGPADMRLCVVNGLLGMLRVESVEKGAVCAFLLAMMIRGLQHAVGSIEKLMIGHECTHLFSHVKYMAEKRHNRFQSGGIVSGLYVVVTGWNQSWDTGYPG
jgi:hypothetical protein